MKKIKILRVIARLNIGGPAINAVLLTGGLDKERFESVLAAGRISENEGDMYYFAQDKNIEPIVIPGLRRKINLIADIAAFCDIYRLILKLQPDIVHTHTAKAGTLGRMAAIIFNLIHRKKVRIIHTFHGHVLRGYFNRFFSYFFILIERTLAGFTDKIIVVSESLKNEILSFGIGDGNKIKVVRLGFDLEQFLNIPPKNRECLNVGLVGRLVPIKNHKMFLDVVKILSTMDYRLSTKFFIIGDGELRSQLENYAEESGIKDRVKFMGWRKDMAKIYEDLDVIVLTSLNEGTPVSLIEALASARSVIAVDVGGVKDVVGSGIYPEIADRGILVKKDDIAGFTDGLKRLLTDSCLRQELSIRGRNFVREKFNSKRLIKDTEMLYNRLLK